MRSQRWFVVVLLGCLVGRGMAARLFVDSRPTNYDGKDRYADILLREIPRQMLISIAIDDFGVEVIDATLEQGAKPAADDVQLGLQRKQDRDGHILHIDLFDADNKIIDATDVTYTFMSHGLPHIQDMVANMERDNRAKWQALLGQRLSANARVIKWDPSQTVAPEIEQHLDYMDFQNSFLAARAIHRAIAENGESPERLAALVRAYTNLAESTRDLISGHSAAMFARAYVYAQRLVRLAPENPLSYWSRAYLESVHGMVLDAEADFKRADELANGTPPPGWVEMSRLLLRYDFDALQKHLQGQEAHLAPYFAWRLVEHSGLDSLTRKVANSALQASPASLRLQNSYAWNASDTYLAQTSAFSMDILNRMLLLLGNNPDEVPAAVREPLSKYSEADLTHPVLKNLVATMRAVPRSDELHLPWKGYASMLSEWHFLLAMTRLDYIDWDTCADPSGEAQKWWPLVSDHRYKVLVASFDHPRHLLGEDALEKLKSLQFFDDTQAFCAIRINHYLIKNGILVDRPHQTNWNDHCVILADRSAYEVAMSLWQYRYTLGPTVIPDRRKTTELLLELAPDHPVGLVWRVVDDWNLIQPRADEITEKLKGNPLASYALGIAYSKSGNFEKSDALLERVLAIAPDTPVFRTLAENRLAQKDVDGYLKVWDRYFHESEDTGSEHTVARFRIARDLVRLNEPEKAIPYAQAASSNGWSDARFLLLLAQTRAGAFERAEMTARGLGTGFWYRWCLETNHGDIATARERYRLSLGNTIRFSTAAVAIDAATFHRQEKNPDTAIRILQPILEQDLDGCAAHVLALTLLEQGKPQEAKEVLRVRGSKPKVDPKTRAYVLAAQAMEAVLGQPGKAPLVSDELRLQLDDPERAATRGNVLCLLGRMSELNGDTKSASQFYRDSLDSLYGCFTLRFAAGDALRKLGEEYYK